MFNLIDSTVEKLVGRVATRFPRQRAIAICNNVEALCATLFWVFLAGVMLVGSSKWYIMLMGFVSAPLSFAAFGVAMTIDDSSQRILGSKFEEPDDAVT